jgi:hypothetical protein
MDYDSGSKIHNDNLYICLLDQIAIFNINDNSIEFNQCIETNNKYYANSVTIKDDLLFIGHWGYFEIFDISDSNNPEFIDELYIDHGATCLAFNSDRTKFISSGGAYLSNYNLSIEYVSNSNDSICNDSIIRNYPNPFNPNTTFVFFLNQDNFIDISIYNTKGQLVKTLINKYQTSGFHNITWDGKDDFHKNVSSGIYFYKLKIDTKITEIGKCILLR